MRLVAALAIRLALKIEAALCASHCSNFDPGRWTKSRKLGFSRDCLGFSISQMKERKGKINEELIVRK